MKAVLELNCLRMSLGSLPWKYHATCELPLGNSTAPQPLSTDRKAFGFQFGGGSTWRNRTFASKITSVGVDDGGAVRN